MKAVLLLALAAMPGWAANFYLTVAGLGGEPDYEQRFSSQAKEIDKLLKAGNPAENVVTLFGPEATKAKIRSALGELARQAKADDTLVMTLIGHGGMDGSEYKLAIPGPDLSASDLASLLDQFPAKRQLVMNASSSSGGGLIVLQKPGRAVITATRSGTEKNATIFGRYWVEALRDSSADTDKNEVISALEAFRYADQKTVRFYESQKRLATEHAMLEDTGVGEPVRSPSPENKQGLVASQIALLRIGAAQVAGQSPEKQKLFARREELERAIDKLKYEKAAMPTDQYRKQLQALLLELARTQEEIEK